MKEERTLTIAVRSSSDDWEMLNKFGALFDKAIFRPVDAVYDERRHCFSITFHGPRETTARGISGLFRRLTKSVFTDARFTIRKVVSCSISTREAMLKEHLTVLFGIQLKSSEFYFCSAEESGGELAFEAVIRVDGIDVTVEIAQ